MSKIVDGVEILRMIKDDEIERGTEIVDSYGNNYIYELDEYESFVLKEYDSITKTFEIPDYTMFIENKFEIKEKEQEIDIQAIEEFIHKIGKEYKKKTTLEQIEKLKQELEEEN